ncbi:hypothetical protein IE53DRAFT_64856 [Violaceomyces palustris]|uniref:Uncharacterized protein n=1 Tax=Violaceomyces palustris TaxID=1673888 RepID=A0ACD0P7H1_9BASI|nr:hypothetical protein IE53DRAFT_64856 [Violaceomyces palustris]
MCELGVTWLPRGKLPSPSSLCLPAAPSVSLPLSSLSLSLSPLLFVSPSSARARHDVPYCLYSTFCLNLYMQCEHAFVRHPPRRMSTSQTKRKTTSRGT